jgi:uncharacterized protein YqfB (UPF0267 family)
MSALKQIKFTYNWNNKLENKFFTTLRISTNWKTGDICELFLMDEHIRNIKIYAIKDIKLSAINEYVAGIDTGYGVDGCKEVLKKMYPNVKNWESQILKLILCGPVEGKHLS